MKMDYWTSCVLFDGDEYGCTTTTDVEEPYEDYEAASQEDGQP